MSEATRSAAGRRPGESKTREAILHAARQQFAELGYDRTSVRSIARSAKVDPALVLHFFGSKQRLFVSVAELPFDPGIVLPLLLEGERAEIGSRLASFFVGVLDSADGQQRMTSLVRAAASEPEAAAAVRAFVEEQVLAPMTAALGVDDGPLRASLLGTQVVGLVMTRYVVAVEPLASANADDVIAAMAPIFQYIIEAPL